MTGSKEQSKKSSESGSQKRLEASVYFLQWTKTSLQSYTRMVNELYLKKLVEHCTRCKLDENSSGRDEVEQLAAGPKVDDKSEHHSIRERLREAAVRMTQWEGDIIIQPNKVCVAELSAMYRLTQLVRVSGTLLDIMERTHKWTDSNFNVLRKHSVSTDIKEHVMGMFNGTRCIAEVFSLESMNVGQCKDVYRSYLDKADYQSSKASELVIGEPKKYIPLLETQINQYRTIVHQLCSAMISIVQTILRKVPQEQVDIHVRELKDALDQLPPMYLKVEDMKLTPLAQKVLKDPPPNKRSYPLAPKEDHLPTSRSGKTGPRSTKKKGSSRSTRRSARQKKSNVTKSKYKNPLSESSNKSAKNSQKSQKTQKSVRDSSRRQQKSDTSKKD